jgi:hypothetical protein
MQPLLRPAAFLGLALVAALSPAPQEVSPLWCAPDPYDDASNPPPGDPLRMGELFIELPPEFAGWIGHTHREGIYYHASSSFALGDLEGRDDGDLDIAIATVREAVLVCRLDLDREARTGRLTPLWFWLSPWAEAALFDPGRPGTPRAHGGPEERNVLVWDLDDDGRNEVVVVAPDAQGQEALFVLGEPRPDSNSPRFSVPEPVELGRERIGFDTDGEPLRLGLCRVRDTDGPRDVCLHSHEGENLPIWKLARFPGGGSDLVRLYDPYIFPGPSSTRNAGGTKTHEFNYADVDGDGYDEFFLDGVLDLVDRVGGVATPTFGMRGVMRWRTGYASGHMDQMIAADWDPDHEGLEILCATEGDWTGPVNFSGPSNPSYHGANKDVLFSADGRVLRENLDAPATDGQEICGGNFTATRPGLEALFCPKDYRWVVVPNCQPVRSGSYAIDAQGRELAMNGVSFLRRTPQRDCTSCCPADPTYPFNDVPPLVRSTGPGWKELLPLDWDGDAREDEILSRPGPALLVWRLGEKGDARSRSPYLPRRDELVDASGDPVPAFHFEGRPYYIHFYTGSLLEDPHPEWAWQNGGPGRYTHYYEKLAAVHPHANLFSFRPYDVLLDQREELLVLSAGGLSIFFNPAPLAAEQEAPRLLHPLYRRWRMERIPFPFDLSRLPEVAALELRPRDPALPARVVGMELESHLPLSALLRFEDGSTSDVSRLVTWSGDPDAGALLPISERGVVRSRSWRGSARFQAWLTLAGREWRSNSVLVLATDREEPVILSAGYGDTFLDQGNPGRPLAIQAQVAQRDNQRPLFVPVLLPDGSFFEPHGLPVWLRDDGDPARGDARVHDGIFSARVAPAPGSAQGLALGDNLLTLRAAYYDGPGPSGGDPLGEDFVSSRAWPYVVLGSGASPLQPPAPYASEDLPAPRVLSCGTRGIEGLSSRFFLEAEVSVPPVGRLSVVAWLPVLGLELPMEPRGDGRFVLDFDLGMPLDRTALVDVRATLRHQGRDYSGDSWPRLWLHDVLPDE